MYLQILLLHEKTEQSNTVTVYIRENSRKRGVLDGSGRLTVYAEGDPEDMRTIFDNYAGVGKKYRKNK
ncbi:hypothetical protein [Simiaoa sp.]|uniref:hypothetical protein n=1 Tax=Simiaoa sp. TaxID=2944202 RepID=UPI003F80099E